MASNRQVTKLEDIAFDALVKQGIFNVEAEANVDPQKASSVIQQKIHARLMLIFLQAVIDNDRKKVAELLDKNPALLLVKAQKGIEIQSQRSWLIIDVENEDALSIAVKRRQIKMIKLLLSYYDALLQTEDVIKAKREALSAWKEYKTQKNPEYEDECEDECEYEDEDGIIIKEYDEIIIPEEYIDYARSLMDLLYDETFPNGVPDTSAIPVTNDIPLNVVLSEKTELALSSLLNILVPKTAVKLDVHIDEELLLLAIFDAYIRCEYDREDKLDTLCIRLLGLTASALIPETAEIYCEGLEDVVTAIRGGKEKEISPRAASHTFKDGKLFYRDSRDSRSGAGFDFLAGADGGGVCSGFAIRMVWKDYLVQKQELFKTLRSSCIDRQTNTCRS